MTNTALREHVTSIGFALTLTKNQINTLVVLHYCDGEYRRFYRIFRDRISKNYCATATALIRRGLMRDHGPGTYQQCELCDNPFCDHRLTRAGMLVGRLLDEAGIYQDALDRYGIERPSAEVSS